MKGNAFADRDTQGESHRQAESLQSKLFLNLARVLGGRLNATDGMLMSPPAEAPRRALHKARTVWPDSASFVVYIPSPLTSYALVDDDAERRLARSRDVAAQVAAAAAAHGFTVLDLSEDVRRAGTSRLLHGPTDWSHFNRDGYELLADTIVRGLSATMP